MKNSTLFFLFLLLASSNLAMAQIPSYSKKEYCEHHLDKNYFKQILLDRSNRMSFTNYGGLLNGGVCWWHSRFQRAATYLTIYSPSRPKPSKKEAKKLIRTIRKRRSVVVIPGYENFYQFSKDWKELIHKSLERWQIIDGFIFQSWVVGLSGRHRTSARKLRDRMDQLYIDAVIYNNISYQMLQFKGISAHAWLVLNMEPIENGYEVQIVDSNYTTLKNYTYQYGDTRLIYNSRTEFVPYLQKKKELERIYQRMKQYCASI